MDLKPNSQKEYTPILTNNIGTDFTYKHKIVWINAIGFLILHLLGIWGFVVMVTGGIQLKTFLWSKSKLLIFN